MTIRTPPPGYILGVDTSASQRKLNVLALQGAGVSFIIAKATDGEHTVDPQWAASALACTDAGIAWTAYGVIEPTALDRAVPQAQHFIDLVKGSGITLAPSIDWELASKLSGHDAICAAWTWVDTVQQALGCACMTYTMPSFVELLERYAGTSAADALANLAKCPLWLAHYTEDFAHAPNVPPPWSQYTIWQASGGHLVSRNYSTLPGTNIDVDVDLFQGTVDQLPAGP